MNMIKQVRFVVVASIVLCVVSSVYALYGVTNKGAWAESWPKELEPLRKQSWTLVHSQYSVHEIPFTSREDFEAAWPHILAVKSAKAPLVLLSSSNRYRNMGETIKAGVRILGPLTGTLVTPTGTTYPAGAEESIPDGKFLRIGPPWPDELESGAEGLPEYVVYEKGKWVKCTEEKAKNYTRKRRYCLTRARAEIELVVDGDIVDLNRIALPADTPIIDKRFEGAPKAEKAGDDGDIVGMYEEVIKLRQWAVDYTEVFVKQGHADITELIDATVKLSEARIQLAEYQGKPDVAADGLRDIVQFYTKMKKAVQTMVETGQRTTGDLHEIEIAILEAKIRLAKVTRDAK